MSDSFDLGPQGSGSTAERVQFEVRAQDPSQLYFLTLSRLIFAAEPARKMIFADNEFHVISMKDTILCNVKMAEANGRAISPTSGQSLARSRTRELLKSMANVVGECGRFNSR